MAWPVGQPRGTKTGGRKAGTPNKRSLEFQKIIDEQVFSPSEALIHIYQEQIHLFEVLKKQQDYDRALLALDSARRTLSDICPYIYPKKKAVEHIASHIMTFSDFIRLSDVESEEEIS